MDMGKTPAAKTRTKGRPALGSVAIRAGYQGLRDRARELKLKTLTDWCKLLLMNQLPEHLPARPELEHPEAFANPAAGWKDFLGLPHLPTADELELLPDVDPRGYVEFEYAREMAKSLRLAHVEDWYRLAGKLHPCCPREPWSVYFLKGYTSLEDFVGLPPNTQR
jgi:hypothetical protein